MIRDLSNENIIHKCENNIEYLQFRKLLEYSDKIKHCYTLKPLDFKITDKVFDNYEKICRGLDINTKNVYMPNQTHSINVRKIENEEPGLCTNEFDNVDGLITDKKNKVLSLTYADCVPLYFYDPIHNVIANIHSGWKGTLKKIAKFAIKSLNENFGVNPKDLICRNWTMYSKLLF